MQKTMIAGRLGRDAEKKIHNGQEYVQFSVAVDDGYYDQNGQWIDRTNWFNCTLWRNVKTDRLKKGAFVLVEGTLRPQIYKDQAGVNKIDLKLNVDTFRVLVKSASDDSAAAQSQQAQAEARPQPMGFPASNPEDIAEGDPF